MANIALLLDEDVRPMLAEIVRQRGYDAIHVLELGAPARTMLSNWLTLSAGSEPSSHITSAISGCSTGSTGKGAKSTSASYCPTKQPSESCFKELCDFSDAVPLRM
jgi:hypothetical protein